MSYPVPGVALDDRLAVIGTSGAGKTYAVLGALVRLLKNSSRFIAADPLGVFWGLRLAADGEAPSPYKPVIFGGAHGDLPLSEGAAGLIGETAANMAESVILDLSGLNSKNAERRFMLGFLTALYRHANRAPVHLVFDEADMWAPQKLFDKDGDAAKLLGMMETVVRRGRIRGFIPWLITQRPAVLSKDVLSQADGVIALKLTSSQDRDAIGGWIEGQADRAKGKEILALLPTLDRGEAVIWIPGRGILETARFPENRTFDSSRTPTRGEAARRVNLKPLDLGKLKERLATVEADAKANDPAALKAEIRRLAGELTKAGKASPTAAAPMPPKDLARTIEAARQQAAQAVREAIPGLLDAQHAASFADGYSFARSAMVKALGAPPASDQIPAKPPIRKELAALSKLEFKPSPASAPAPVRGMDKPAPRPGTPQPAGDGSALPQGERTVLTAIAQYGGLEREQLTALTGYKRSTRNLYLQKLQAKGFVEISGDAISLTESGSAALPADYEPLPTGEALQRFWLAKLPGGEGAVLQALIAKYPGGLTREEISAATNYKSSTRNLYLQKLKSKRLWEESAGLIRASEALF